MSLSLCHPGAKHKSMLEGHSTQVRRGRGKLLSRAGHKSKRIGNKGSINIQNKAFHCQVCEIYVNSETQLKQVRTPSLVCVFPLGGAGAQGMGVQTPLQKHLGLGCTSPLKTRCPREERLSGGLDL